jgi:ferredoxin
VLLADLHFLPGGGRNAGARTQANLLNPAPLFALLASLSDVTYVIAGSCIKDDSCIEVCPVDCIHPKPGSPEFESAEQLYIDPAVCIDCDACVEACPVDAIFAEFEIPEKFGYALDLNAEFFAERGTAERTAA